MLMSALQCFFYPCLVPLLRNKVREAKGIEGSVLEDIALGWCCPCCMMLRFLDMP